MKNLQKETLVQRERERERERNQRNELCEEGKSKKEKIIKKKVRMKKVGRGDTKKKDRTFEGQRLEEKERNRERKWR